MRILVTGGGTGGHIYPALAIVRELKQIDDNLEVLYIGTERGLEREIVEREGIPFKHIEIAGFRRSLSLENVKTVVKFLRSLSVSRKYIKGFNPDVVVGTGGYVCGPIVFTAAMLKIPTLIHEQNSLPGITNKFLAKFVDKIAICFEEARTYFPEEKVVLTGNPRASEVAQTLRVGKSALGLDPTKKTVLISGGSRGAEPINDAFISMIEVYENEQYEVVFVTGAAHFESIKARIKGVDSLKNIHVLPFINNMPQYLVSIDLFVGRSGATFLSEITALGVPSILIPSPYVTENHQEFNARSVTDHGGGVLILEKELTGERLHSDINRILENSQLNKEMANISKQLGIPDAASRVIKVLNEIIEKE